MDHLKSGLFATSTSSVRRFCKRLTSVSRRTKRGVVSRQTDDMRLGFDHTHVLRNFFDDVGQLMTATSVAVRRPASARASRILHGMFCPTSPNGDKSMKNFALTTLALVTLTMLLNTSAEAQGIYPNAYPSYHAPRQFAPSYVPTNYSTYGTNYSNGACANGRCNVGYRSNACPNGICGIAHAPGACPGGRCGTSTPYRANYGFGSRLGSWLGLNPRSISNYPPVYRTTPVYGPITPSYSSNLYGSTGYSNSLNSSFGTQNGHQPFYGSY